jgi:hypothetical protein
MFRSTLNSIAHAEPGADIQQLERDLNGTYAANEDFQETGHWFKLGVAWKVAHLHYIGQRHCSKYSFMRILSRGASSPPRAIAYPSPRAGRA